MNDNKRQPLRIINSVAPIRICDNGGWTDTWFAGHGKIFNIGVYPYAEVQLAVYRDGEQEDRIIINAENYGERYAVVPEVRWNKHPLLGWVQGAAHLCLPACHPPGQTLVHRRKVIEYDHRQASQE